MNRLDFYWRGLLAVAVAVAFAWFVMALRQDPLPMAHASNPNAFRPRTASGPAPADSQNDASAAATPASASNIEAPAAVPARSPATKTEDGKMAKATPDAPPPATTPARPTLSAEEKAELGRLILPLVGATEEANEVWITLISDPSLSAKIREDLIEDLNETGFSDDDGRRPTVDDIPLIQARIQLLEEHGVNAIDETAAAAFAEAYKDLIEILERLGQQL